MIIKNTFKKHQGTMLIGLAITAVTLSNYVHANELK